MIESIKLKNTKSGQIITIDQDQSQFVLTELDLGQVSGTHNSYSFYNQIGSTIESTTIENRPVSITGWVIGDTREEITTNKKILNRFINPMQDIQLMVYDRYSLTFRPDYSVQYGKTIEENNECMCKFLIQGTCGNPLFGLVDMELISMSTTEPKFKFPLIIPQDIGTIFGNKKTNRLEQIENDGDFPAGMVITLIAKGSVVQPKITLVETQESIELNKTLEEGETVIISTIYGEKYIDSIVNGVRSNCLGHLKYPSTWLQLNPGSNAIQYSAQSGVDNLQVTIEFSPGYMEVEQ